MQYEFYQIKSKKSEPEPGKEKQICLACLGQPELKIFLWFDRENALTHIQFCFDECILDWKLNHGLRLQETDRRNISLETFGNRKGSRTTKDIFELEVYQKSQLILKNASLPQPYKSLIIQFLT